MEANPKKAAEEYLKIGSGDAFMRLGLMKEIEDPRQSMSYYIEAAKRGHPKGIEKLLSTNMMRWNSLKAGDLVKAAHPIYLQLAQKGDERAAYITAGTFKGSTYGLYNAEAGAQWTQVANALTRINALAREPYSQDQLSPTGDSRDLQALYYIGSHLLPGSSYKNADQLKPEEDRAIRYLKQAAYGGHFLSTELLLDYGTRNNWNKEALAHFSSLKDLLEKSGSDPAASQKVARLLIHGDREWSAPSNKEASLPFYRLALQKGGLEAMQDLVDDPNLRVELGFGPDFPACLSESGIPNKQDDFLQKSLALCTKYGGSSGVIAPSSFNFEGARKDGVALDEIAQVVIYMASLSANESSKAARDWINLIMLQRESRFEPLPEATRAILIANARTYAS